MERRTFAVWTIVIGLLVGVVGSIFFFRNAIGLSFPLFTLIVTLAVLASSAFVKRPLKVRRLWLLIPLLFFAVMVAVRADFQFQLINVAAVLCLGALAIYYLPLPRFLDQDSLGQYVAGLAEASIGVVWTPIVQLTESWGWFRERSDRSRKALTAVARGLIIAVPILVVFGALLASADAIFGDYVDQLGQSIFNHNFDALLWRGTLIVILGWLACGAMAFGLLPRETAKRTAAEDEAGEDQGGVSTLLRELKPAPQTVEPKPGFRLGIIESSIVLGSVDLMFGAFVVIQFTYFFGGQMNVSLAGWTFAEYARRGFFELVAVSVLTLGLALWLDRGTLRHNRWQQTTFRVLAVTIVALTTVMLVSAWQRMALYEQAYGFTHLRVQTDICFGGVSSSECILTVPLFCNNCQHTGVGSAATMLPLPTYSFLKSAA